MPTNRTRTAALLSTIPLAISAVGLTAPAAEAGTTTDYGFQTLAFGTRAKSDTVGLRSDRSAYSHIRCSRVAGRHNKEFISAVDLPADDAEVRARAVHSLSTTYQTRSGNQGTRSVSRLGKVVLGSGDGPRIVIRALRAESRAWADDHGKLHAKNTFSSSSISGNTGTDLDDVLDQAGAGLGDLLAAIEDEGGSYEIPGLGTLAVGASAVTRGNGWARAAAVVLRLDLPDAVTRVHIGRSYARINRDAPAGVMNGEGYGAQVPSVLGGSAAAGRLGERLLPCAGTHGDTRRSDIAGLDLGNAGMIELGALTGKVNGRQHGSGRAAAWTLGRVASLTLGPIELEGIVGRANIVLSKKGDIHSGIKGSRIGSLTIAGEEQQAPDPGDTIEVPGVARLTFFVKDRDPHAISVTAVKVELLGDVSGPDGTVLRLGNAKARLKRR